MRFGSDDNTGTCPFKCGQKETAMHFCECSSDLSIKHKTIHLQAININLKHANTCPTLRRAIIEAISIHCNITVTDPFSPAFSSTRANNIKQAIADQTNLGVNHLLKGRVIKALFEPQLAYFEKLPPTKDVTPAMKWKTWRKKVIKSLTEFTLNIWKDRNSVVHGTPIKHSKLELIAHVHHVVRTEYHKHKTDKDPFMNVHFEKPVEEKLKATLKGLRYWLKRVEESRIRLRLLKEAKAKIQRIQAENNFIDSEEILTMPNRTLRKWISNKFVPIESSQTTIDRFFRA